MKTLRIKITSIIILVVLSFGLIGCDNDSVKDDFVQDYNTAWDDSGLDTAAGTIDNLLVGGITGIDYTE